MSSDPKMLWTAAKMLSVWGWVRVRLALGLRTPKATWRWWYDNLSQLTDSIFGELPFMNYGYASDAQARDAGLDPERATAAESDNWTQVGMYWRTLTNAGAMDPADLDVLEVGCGRGGGSAFVARHLGPRSVCGADFSAAAVEFCRRQHHGVDGLRFVQGDAEALPFDDESFDRVLNVESSHCYPDLPAFLGEVRRVLRPGGTLHLVDFRTQERLAELEGGVRSCGLELVHREDVTDAVVAAMRSDHDRKVRTIETSGAPGFLHSALRQFTGCMGSPIFEDFVAHRRSYLRYVLRKPSPSSRE